jgi:hypothetical protein
MIHLPNPDLTYIRNPERETKLCYALSPLKTYIRSPEIKTKLFHLLSMRRGYAWRGEGCEVAIDTF